MSGAAARGGATARRWAAGVSLALAGAAAWWWSRGPRPGHEGPEPRLAPAEAAGAEAWFLAARRAATGPAHPGAGPREAIVCRVDPGRASSCAVGAGADWAEAVSAAAAGHPWAAEGVLRVELVLEARASWFPRDADPHLAGARTFRVGDRVLPGADALARGLFRSEEEDDAPTWDADGVTAALGLPAGPFAYDALTTAAFVQEAAGVPPRATYRLHGDAAPDTSPQGLAEPLRLAGEHLLSLVGPDGRIRYRYDPRTGREVAGSNLLRHAGTTWSLVRAHERTGDPRFLEAAGRALEFLLRHTGTDERQGPRGGGRVRFVVEGSHLKLGGAGLALVALSAWRTGSGDDRWDEPSRQLARYLLSQQQASGEFWSYAPRVDGQARKDAVSAYYPGEAILGLVSWYALDPDPQWLDAAVRGADWLLDVRDAGRGVDDLDADHWLMMALERLHAVTGDPRYEAHAVRLAEVVAHQQEAQRGHAVFHPDYAGGFYEPPRSTPASIRAEGVGAVLDLCGRTGRDCRAFLPVLHAAVGHALWSQIGPRDTWWMRDPAAALGGFGGGIVDPELRNDYSQHAYCALLAAERHPLR